MADLRSQVQQALSGSYTLERELGGGGMSRVFLTAELQPRVAEARAHRASESLEAVRRAAIPVL
jgi:hypothetical protein